MLAHFSLSLSLGEIFIAQSDHTHAFKRPSSFSRCFRGLSRRRKSSFAFCLPFNYILLCKKRGEMYTASTGSYHRLPQNLLIASHILNYGCLMLLRAHYASITRLGMRPCRGWMHVDTRTLFGNYVVKVHLVSLQNAWAWREVTEVLSAFYLLLLRARFSKLGFISAQNQR